MENLKEEMKEEDIELDDNLKEESDLYEHHHYVVDAGQALLRIDKFLMGRIQNASRNKIQNAAHAGNILVNEKTVKPNYRVRPLDVISILLAYPPRETEIIPENIPLDIVYQDNDLLIVNKSAGMVVHPGHGNYTGTLVHALAYIFQEQKIDSETGPFLLHRIDKGTTGLLMVAKNELAQSILARDFFNHKVGRKYHALVWGDVEEDAGTIEGHIGRSHRDRKVMDVYTDGSVGKASITHYRVLQRFHYVTLIECTLETGRTHQIRAHMKFFGHPLFGDETYGGLQILKGSTFSKYKQFVNNCFEILSRQALHAKSIAFKHPSTGKELYFESELPSEMKQVLEKWETYTNAGNKF